MNKEALEKTLGIKAVDDRFRIHAAYDLWIVLSIEPIEMRLEDPTLHDPVLSTRDLSHVRTPDAIEGVIAEWDHWASRLSLSYFLRDPSEYFFVKLAQARDVKQFLFYTDRLKETRPSHQTNLLWAIAESRGWERVLKNKEAAKQLR